MWILVWPIKASVWIFVASQSLCGFLWPIKASCGFLWPGEASGLCVMMAWPQKKKKKKKKKQKNQQKKPQ
jgi:hypothetical protein